MSEIKTAVLDDRGVVAVSGLEAGKFLHGLITNDMALLSRAGDAVHAALLTPQGKILFAFFVVRTGDGYLLETGRDEAPALARRLGFYRLRAAVQVEDVSQRWRVQARWSQSGPVPPADNDGNAIGFTDPRNAGLGLRVLQPVTSPPLPTGDSASASYHSHRIALGVPAAGLDYDLGDTFPHEADFDLQHGVDFDKGCFVGQEVVARMQHKAVVRKRIVRVSAAQPLPDGRPDIVVGSATIGRLGSVAGSQGLAIIRLDRAAEMIDKGEQIRAAGIALEIDPAALAAYRAAASERMEAT